MNKHIIYFPKDGQPTLLDNEWQVWDGERDEGGIPDLEHGLHKVLVPFHWWVTHHKNADVQDKAHKGEVGVWFAADDDILKHAEIIEEGQIDLILNTPNSRGSRSDSYSIRAAAIAADIPRWKKLAQQQNIVPE